MEWRPAANGADGAAPDALVRAVPPAPSRASSLLVSLVLCLLAAVVLRAVLPRLPRLLFRGRLRVRRVGLRGVRGIEWRQHGFVRKRSPTGTAVGAREDDGLVVRVQHIYLVFHGWRRRAGGGSAADAAAARAAEPALSDGDATRSAVAAPTAWVTIRIQGVGVRLAKAASGAEAQAAQARAAEARRREMEEEAHRRAEAAEAHLQRLIASTPDASALETMAEDGEGDTSVESMVSPPRPSDEARDAPPRAHPPKPEDAHGLPLRGVLLVAFFLRYRVLPVVRIQSVRLARALVYVVISALPALTSFVDVELQRAEVFMQDAESVLRIGRMTLLVSMAVADEPDAGETGAADDAARRCASSASFAGRVSAAFKEMPGRLGSGAAGAATYIKANLPAGRASLQVRMEGLQVFEAHHEMPHSERPKARLPESRPSSPSPQAWRGPSSRRARRPTSPPETPVRSGSALSPLLRSASSTSPGSPQLHASRAGIDAVPAQWLPFSATPPSQEPPTLKRSHSTSGLAALATQPLSGWTDRWADWALEPFPSSSYSSDTGWAKGDARGPVPESARLLALPDVSVFELGIALDPNLAIGARETVSLRLQLAAVTVGMDAVARTLSVLEQRKSMHPGLAPTKKGLDGTRSQVSKHFAQQRREPAARMLYALSSVSVTMPSALFLSDIHTSHLAVTQQAGERDKILPRSLQFRTTLRHLSLSLRTSDAADARHRHWLGSCGVKGRRAEPSNMPSVSRSAIGGLKKGIQDRFRWAALRSRARYVEHRQAFTLEAGMESLEALVGTEGRSVELASELLLLREAKLSARSTWTPFGLLPTQCPVDSPLAAQYFVGDPNEQVAFIEASVRQVHGETSLQHAAALGTTLAALLAERKRARAELGLQEDRPPKPPGPALQPPRLFLGAAVHDCSYHLNLGPQKRAGTDALLGEVSLIANAPRLSLTLQTAYQDAYVGRTENERRHAWKTHSRAARDKPDSPPAARPPFARMTSSSSTVSAASHEAIPPPAPPKEGMTMNEALAQMRELQQQSHAKGEAGPPLHLRPSSSASDRRAAASARDRRGKQNAPRAISGPPEANLRYTFDARIACEPIEAFFAVTGDDNSSRRRDDTPTAGRHLPRLGMTRHHLLLISAIESKLSGHVPGFQDCMDTVQLAPKKAAVDVVLCFEELDIDMWHPAALGATRGLVRVLSDAAALAARISSAATSQQPSEPTASAAADTKPLIDRVPATDCSLYASVGTIIMHVGGSDVNCDPHMSRGVGFEAKRVVFEAVSTKYDARRAPDISAGWGSRTALELPEELMLSAHALASRYGKAAAAKLSLFEIGLFPILDAEQALRQHMDGNSGRTRRGMHRESSSEATAALMASPSIFAPAVWEFQKTRPQQTKKQPTHAKFRQQDRSNFIFWMPFSATKAFLRPPGAVSGKVGKRADEVTVTSEGTPLLALKIELLHTYCILNAFAALKGLAPQRREQAKREQPEEEAAPSPAAYRPSFSVAIDVQEVHMTVRLPSDVNLFVQFRRLDLRLVDRDSLSLALEQVMAAVETPQRPSKGLWEEAVRFRDWKFQVRLPDRHTGRKLEVAVNGDGLRVRIPFGYPVHPIIDNAAVAFKTTKQLVAQFVKGSKESVIYPVPEDPKHLPKISVNVRIFVIEAQDDPIEVRLNSIWRAGGDENQARMERDVAFADKVSSLRESAEDDAASFLSHAAGSIRTNATASTSGAASGAGASMHSPSSASLPSDLPDRASSESEQAEADPAAVKQQFQQRTSATVKKAREQLDAFNASSWIRRSKNAYLEMSRREEAAARRIYGRYPTQRVSSDLPIKMVTPARAPPLFRSSMSKLALDVGPPSFAEDKLRDFIHEQGKGVPRDLGYSLLVPMHLRWRMAEWRIQLRDYPMPLLHIPPMHRDQPDDLRSWDLEGDVVLAEHCGGSESIRHVPAVVVPAATGLADAKEYGISVPKMAMPVKFYGSPSIKINTSYPTRATWGQSMQPAIHDMARVLDTVTSPPHDPSAKLGFWDKLPLVVHGRFGIQFVGDGELHLYLKGSRDPYSILGHGSGWVMCWRGNVDVRLNQQNPDQEVFQILAHQFLLAIPDLRDYIDQAATGVTADKRQEPDDSDRRSGNATLLSAGHRYTEEIDFRKVVLRLTNGVRWGIGIKCERTCTDETCKREPRCSGPAFYRECRFFDAKPHWEVHTRTKEYLDTLPESERGDSFAGYRTDHIHFSLSIFSRPGGLHDYTVRPRSDSKASDSSANNFYFTPLAWENFWAWMRLFNGAMSLPIRQGPLFPEAQAQSPKFGRHLATLKYRFDLAPLFISHVYPQNIRSDWAPGRTTLIGVKARVGTFHLDMHQRQQEMLKDRPEFGDEKKKVFHKPFYEAEMDLDKIDLRTLCAQFTEPDKRLFPSDEDPVTAAAEGERDIFAGDCTLSDRDLEWLDIRDFIEVDWKPPESGEDPKVKLAQAMVCPHFNYHRRLESQRERSHRTASQAKQSRRATEQQQEEILRLEFTKFGREDSHTCLVGKGPHSFDVQQALGAERISQLHTELDKLCGADRDHEAAAALRKKIQLITEYLSALKHEHRVPDSGEPSTAFPVTKGRAGHGSDKLVMPHMYADWESFNNRHLVHNPTIFFSNTTRDVLLKYYLSSRQRRGVVHHLTARAVRYIRELSARHEGEDPDDESKSNADADAEASGAQDAQRSGSTSSRGGRRRRQQSRKRTRDTAESTPVEEKNTIELLQGLLTQTANQVMVESPTEQAPDSSLLDDDIDASEGISDQFDVRRSTICVLVKPQIVLRSEMDERSTIVLTATRTRLRNFSVIDPRSEEDSVNERVLHRNYFTLDGLQAFHPSNSCSFLATANERSGFVYVPLETLVDFKYETNDFDRVVPHTDASVRYDKFNKLRLNDSSRPVAADETGSNPALDHLVHHMDLARLRCPRFGVVADASHFAAIYNVVTDLLLYRDPAYREHSKRLETMLFSHDFSDTSGLAEVVAGLQYRIRHARELHAQYLMHFEHLNEHGRLDLLALKAEMQDMLDELNLVMEAIATSEEHSSGSDKDKKSALRVEAVGQDITWSMMGADEGELLAKLSVKGASFTWLNKTDNSAANTLSIADLSAVNVHPDAFFAEILSKYKKGAAANHAMAQRGRFLDAMWSVMAPVGGISIVDQFDFKLHPMRLQLESKVGNQLMEYIFGSKRERERRNQKQKADEDESRSPDTTDAAKASTTKSKRGRGGRLARLFRPGHGNERSEASEATRASPPAAASRGSTELAVDRPRRPSSTRSTSYTNGSGRDSSRSRPATPQGAGSRPDSDEESDPDSHMAIVSRNAAEMRQRAASNRTFVLVKIADTIFNLSYKGEKEKSITNVYDLVFHSPNIEYRNRTWAYVDLANHFKRDIIRAAWGQKTSILRGVLNHRPRRTSLRAHLPARIASGAGLSVRVEPPTPTSSMLIARDDEPDTPESPQSMLSDLEEDRSSDEYGEHERDVPESDADEPHSGNTTASRASTASPGRFSRFITKRLGRPRSGSGSSGATHETVRMDRDDSHSSDPDGSSSGLRSPGDEARRMMLRPTDTFAFGESGASLPPRGSSRQSSPAPRAGSLGDRRASSPLSFLMSRRPSSPLGRGESDGPGEAEDADGALAAAAAARTRALFGLDRRSSSPAPTPP